MIIDFSDEEKLSLLETLATAFAVEHLKGNDGKILEILIQKIADSLKNEGKFDIFEKVFYERK